MRRVGVDLRLALPAAAAWLSAGLVVAVPSVAVPVAVALWCVALGVLVVAVSAQRSWPAMIAVGAVAAAIVCSSVAAHAPARQPASLVAAARDHHRVTLTVTLEQTLKAAPRDETSTTDSSTPVDPYRATVTSAQVGQQRLGGLSAPVLVFGGRAAVAAGIGATLTVAGSIVAADPGDDVGFLVFADGTPRVTRGPPWFLDWANRLRASFVTAATALPGEGGALLPGLAIGDTSAVDDGLDAAMKATSLSHLTAVSGANCAVVIGLIMLLGAAVGLSRGARIATSCLVLVGFVVLVTPQASVVRAAVMAAIVLLATLGGRPVRGIPVLALASLVLLANDPWLSRDYGFALSVLATGGLLVLSGPLTRLLARVLPMPVAAVIAIPLAAQLACQPVLLLLNPAVPLFGVVANILAEPAAPLATVIGLLACLALPVVPWLGHWLTAVAWLPASWIASVATFFAPLPAAALPWPEGLAGVALMSAVTVAALLAALGPGSRRARFIAALLAVVLLAGFAGASAGVRVTRQLALPGDWQIAACDIGQGDAVLVRSAGEIALVDTGPDADLLTACLDTLGISRVNLLVLSHFDLDHVGGTAAVVGRVDRALVGPAGEPADDRLVADLVHGGAVVEQAARGDSGLLGELRYSVLWPRARLGAVEPGNAASVTVAFAPVGRCADGCLSSLFLGDLGERSQALVLAAGAVPRVDVVKVSHHGSADQSQRLYETVGATLGIISVGIDNDYGHPTDRLLDLLAGVGTAVARTDRQGLVLVSPGSRPGEVRVWSERSPP